MNLIEKLKKGGDKRKVAEEFGVAYSTACAIVKDKANLFSALSANIKMKLAANDNDMQLTSFI